MVIFELQVNDKLYIIEIPTRIVSCMYKLRCNNKDLLNSTDKPPRPFGYLQTEREWFKMLNLLQNKPNTQEFIIDREKFIQMYLYNPEAVYTLMLENICFEIK